MSCGPIQILQSPDSVELKQHPNSLSVNQSPYSLEIKTFPENVQIIQEVTVVKVCALNPVSTFLPFSFTATQDNQTVFGPLQSIPMAIITLAITGTLQDPAGVIPDYTIDELSIVLSQGISAGNTVYGVYQVS